MTRIVGLLLAAGSARRFGSHKLLAALPPHGEPIAARSAANLAAALPGSVAVVRPGDKKLADLLQTAGLQVVENPDADDGIGRSIAVGVGALTEAGGWVIALADMPWIEPATICAVADALRAGASLAAPANNGRRGHPVGFAARWHADLSVLQGDRGARGILQTAKSELVLLPSSDLGILRDVDHPHDLVSAATTDSP